MKKRTSHTIQIAGLPYPYDSTGRLASLAMAVTPLLLIACANDPSNEEAAEAAGLAAATTVSALSTSGAVGSDASESQQGDQPTEPASVSGAGCMQTELRGGELWVDFGTGCVINNVTYAGSYGIGLMLTGGLGLSITFVDYSVDGKTQNGDMSMGLARGRVEAAMDLSIMEQGQPIDIDFNGTLLADSTSMTFDGAGSYDDGVTNAFDGNGIHVVYGECYPDAGTLFLQLDGYTPLKI